MYYHRIQRSSVKKCLHRTNLTRIQHGVEARKATYSAHTPTNLPEPTMSTGQQKPILVDIAERIKCPIQAPVHSWSRLFLRASTVSLRVFSPHSWDLTIAAGLSSPTSAGRFALEHWSSTGAKNSGLTVRICS
ncbi:hypothetical protein B0T26DRAFT_39392 [Lasiosphaeria miniovina]|uniref:Uncharacterized protein n=1 Tax=Lasiosphaeria miniovina TaxID=1954250 RepID=A0AA40E9Y9_9PEZI|nr:uncharacterized protein B0T26DRAFT_39392 [Lasiosphaeria miniovina]KAK0733849.1 hypothetical protein B0T26DRAFT_39392 [Lasiosphaeria miniovina]